MPTLVLDLPLDIYEELARRAAAQQRSLPQETFVLLRQALQTEPRSPRWPELIPTDELSAPTDLPRSSQPVRVPALMGQLRLPDPPLDFQLEAIIGAGTMEQWEIGVNPKDGSLGLDGLRRREFTEY